MVDTWVSASIGDIAHLKSGKFLPPEDRIASGGYPVYGANGVIARCAKPLVSEPVITVGRVGAIGRVQQVAEPAWISDNALIVTAGDRVTTDFLRLLLEHLDYSSMRSGSSQPLIKQSALAACEVRLPSLVEQRRITAVHETIDRAVKKAEIVADTLAALREAFTADRYGRLDAENSDRVRLGDLVERVKRPVTVDEDGEYIQVGIRSFGKGFFLKAPVTARELGNKKLFEIRDGDLVFNIVFSWEGAVALAGPDEDQRVASHRFPTYRVDPARCLAPYLLNFFRAPGGLRLLEANSPGSAGRNRTLNQTALLDEMVCLPSLAEQTEVVSTLESVVRAERAALERLETVRTVRSSAAIQLLGGNKRVHPSYEGPSENADAAEPDPAMV